MLNNHQALKVQAVNWQEASSILSSIRRTVFIEEQGVAEHEEWDTEDEHAQHFIVYLNNQPIGCARLLASGQIGRFAILAEHRNQGFGQQLLRHIAKHAWEANRINTLFLHAQLCALGFYQKLGFCEYGDVFLDAGIEHKSMRFSLFTEGAATQNNALKLFDNSVLRFEDRENALNALLLCIANARKEVRIYSSKLDHSLYGDSQFIEKLSQIARHNRNSEIKVLLQNSRPLHGRRHPLIELAQRLPSKIQVRITARTVDPTETACITADRKQIVFFNNEDALKGFLNLNDQLEVKNRIEEFDYIWQKQSETDPNLQRLSL